MEVPEFAPDGSDLIYVAVADHLAARIAAGQFQPGDRLIPERELAAEYHVAYLTMRQAMKVLRERGIIKTVHGKGTFVVEQEPPAGE